MSLRNKKIVVLGSRGMLGQMAKKYFSSKGYDVICFDDRYTIENRIAYISFLSTLKNAVVINCIGKIKQKTDDTNDLLFVNTIFPTDLRNVLSDDVIMIHPSTDCVFDGMKGIPYHKDDMSDAYDDYGFSKRLAEVALTGRHNTLITRVSLIGPDENANGKSLMAWVFSQKRGSSVNGYINHLWNGITTLEWCKQVETFLLNNERFKFLLIQYGTKEHHTKYGMVSMFNELFGLGLEIKQFETSIPVDRRLTPEIICKPLNEQLQDIKEYIK